MLSCHCDNDYPTFYSEDERTCRKPRKCSECRRAIAPGERYVYISGKWDGDFNTFRVCAHCDAATRYIQAVVACWCFPLGMRWFPEDGDDEFRGEPSAVRRLVVTARRKWARRRGPRKGELYPVPWVPKLETA